MSQYKWDYHNGDTIISFDSSPAEPERNQGSFLALRWQLLFLQVQRRILRLASRLGELFRTAEDLKGD